VEEKFLERLERLERLEHEPVLLGAEEIFLELEVAHFGADEGHAARAEGHLVTEERFHGAEVPLHGLVERRHQDVENLLCRVERRLATFVARDVAGATRDPPQARGRPMAKKGSEKAKNGPERATKASARATKASERATKASARATTIEVAEKKPVALTASHRALIAALGVGDVPDVPKGWKAPTAAQVKGFSKPLAEQIVEAPQAAGEIEGGAKYDDDFGKRAPKASLVVAALRTAAGASALAARASAFEAYARGQSERAWNDAFVLLNKLKTQYDNAVADEPSLADEYPSLDAFFAGRTTAAAKGVATKRTKKKAGAKTS
jgi:hypothetical protein